MSLPYRWHPSGTRRVSQPEPGMFLPYEHKVYRIVEVNPVPDESWSDEDRKRVGWSATNTPRMIVVRPIDVTSTDVRARDHDKHFRVGGERTATLYLYTDTHYPICAECHEPLPCRDQMAEQVSTKAAEQMVRYEVPGVCPACSEVVTHRQRSQTWPDNAVIPGGPPITFHLRGKCHYEAVRYEKQWAALDPDRRRMVLSCEGHVTNHNDGTYQCTELTECPGPTAHHPSHTICRCPDCHARGVFGCFPSPTSRNRAFDDEGHRVPRDEEDEG